ELRVVDVVERALLATDGQHDVIAVALELDLDLSRRHGLDGGLCLGGGLGPRATHGGLLRGWRGGGLGGGSRSGAGSGRGLGGRCVLLRRRSSGLAGTGGLRGGLILTRSSSHSDPLGSPSGFWARDDPCQ